jgi:hypothetical protein
MKAPETKIPVLLVALRFLVDDSSVFGLVNGIVW